MTLAERLEQRQKEREQQERAEREARYNVLLRIPLDELTDAQADELEGLINLLGGDRKQAEADRRSIERERAYMNEANRLMPESVNATKAIKGLRQEEAAARAELTRIQREIDAAEVPIKAREKAMRLAEEVRRMNGKLFS